MNEVNHPLHYNVGKIEVIEFIEDQKLGYHLGNAIKYICRCDYKEKKKQDLEKAIWYLRREIELLNPEPRRPNNMAKKENYDPATFEPSAMFEENKCSHAHTYAEPFVFPYYKVCYYCGEKWKVENNEN